MAVNTFKPSASATPPGQFSASVFYVASATNYWTNANTSAGDFTVTGTIPDPSTYFNNNWGTISKATSSMPGINFSAPRSGIIKMTAVISVNENALTAQRQWAVFLYESVTATYMASAVAQSSSINGASGLKVVTIVGYFSATVSTTYNFKIQSLVSADTLYIYSAAGAGAMLSFQMEYIT